MTVKKYKQQTIYDIYFDEERELLKTEKANISKKVKDGYLNVHWFRHNLFNATVIGKCVKYQDHKGEYKPKSIFKNHEMEIMVSHFLTQKHADLLSVLYIDNVWSQATKIKDDGSFFLYTRLYYTAKKMGYKNPKGSIKRIKVLLNDLRDTDFIIRKVLPNSENKHVEICTKILGDSEYISVDELYRVAVSARSARVLAMSVAVKIDKALNEKIIAIPDNRSKIKALIRYVLANTVPPNGLTLEGIFNKFGIGNEAIANAKKNAEGKALSTIRKERSVFKSQIIEYKDILKEFNIRFDEEKQKIYPKKHNLIGFEMNIEPSKVVDQIEENKIDKYIGKWIQPKDEVFAQITHITELETDNFSVEAIVAKTGKKIIIPDISKENIEEILDDDANEHYGV